MKTTVAVFAVLSVALTGCGSDSARNASRAPARASADQPRAANGLISPALAAPTRALATAAPAIPLSRPPSTPPPGPAIPPRMSTSTTAARPVAAAVRRVTTRTAPPGPSPLRNTHLRIPHKLHGHVWLLRKLHRHVWTPRTRHGPLSWLANATLLTVYGRAFGVAPILGRLGMDNNFADLEWQIQPYARGIKANNGSKDTRITIHLIYGMAIGCSPGSNCLLYLDDVGVDVVKEYIEPAARRHWLVVLDDQLGRSDPVTEVRRLIARGYLRYDNVEVALDPEFRAGPDQLTPGIPVGWVTAEELNSAQAIINAYTARHHLLHRKVLMVHQFQWGMIVDRPALRTDFPYVDPVIIADGFGGPGLKAHIYSELLGPRAPGGVKWRGIKLFYPNPYENAGHGDVPLLDWSQVFGHTRALDTDGKSYRIRPQPNVVVIA